MTVFIGDVHGKYKQYKRILETHINTIQIGDLGLGFRHTQGLKTGEFTQNPPHYAMLATNARFIRGNHDNPSECKRHTQWISDGHTENEMMFIGGGLSIDKAYRTEGYSYWSDEELNQKEFDNLLTVYQHEKPKIMVTHECPEDIATAMQAHSGRSKLEYPSITRQAFQQMLSCHSPKLWVFGHWHYSFDVVSQGTRFVCLAELEVKNLTINT